MTNLEVAFAKIEENCKNTVGAYKLWYTAKVIMNSIERKGKATESTINIFFNDFVINQEVLDSTGCINEFAHEAKKTLT